MKHLLSLLMLLVSLATAKGQCDWSKAGIFYTNKCGVVKFEMGSFIDSCISYTTIRYNHKTGIKDTIAHDRVFTRTMDTGLYTFRTSFHCSCMNCDTVIYKERVHIGCETSSIKDVEKPEPQIIGIYDMMGRPVKGYVSGKILIYVYDNKTVRKILIQ